MTDEKKSPQVERKLSLAMGVGFALWDAYAQAHGIPYTMPPFVYGIVMYPWGESAYAGAKDVLTKLPDVANAGKRLLLKITKKE